VVKHRGARIGAGDQKVVPLWEQRQLRGERIFRINRKHPVIVELLTGSDLRVGVRALLKLLEETIPVPLLPVSKPSDALPFDGAPPDDVLKLGEQLYERFLETGSTRADARARVLQCEPFALWPEHFAHLGGGRK
jgi:hypothetical protein